MAFGPAQGSRYHRPRVRPHYSRGDGMTRLRCLSSGDVDSAWGDSRENRLNHRKTGVYIVDLPPLQSV
jgi:hypothetical protein